MDEGNWKLTAVQTDPIPYLGDSCPRVSSISAIQTEPGLLIKPPGIPVFFEYPERHFGESAALEFVEYVIQERAAVAVAAQVRSEERRVGKECRSRWWRCGGK